jgi:hypothetical protein
MSHERQPRCQAYNPLTMARWCHRHARHALHTLQQRGVLRTLRRPDPSTPEELVSRLCPNALGEVLEPGRVPDCYLGLRLDPTSDAEEAGVLMVAPAALLAPVVPQPDGTVV